MHRLDAHRPVTGMGAQISCVSCSWVSGISKEGLEMRCEKCQKEYPSRYYFDEPGICIYCQKKLREGHEVESQTPSSMSRTETATPKEGTSPGQAVTDALRIFAWLNLFAGIILGMLVWAQFASSGYEPNALAIVAGLVLMLEGICSYIFFATVVSISDKVSAIRRKIES